jgi:hypothetical protein
MPGKGGKGGVDHQFSSSGVVQGDQRPGVVDQHLLRHPLPEAECLLERLQQVALLLLLPVHPDHLSDLPATTQQQLIDAVRAVDALPALERISQELS